MDSQVKKNNKGAFVVDFSDRVFCVWFLNSDSDDPALAHKEEKVISVLCVDFTDWP